MSQHPTGADLVHQLWKAARAKSVALNDFVKPLSPEPGKWVKQLSEADRPTPTTIARVTALIEGREIPPARSKPASPYSTCRRTNRELLGLAPSARQVNEANVFCLRAKQREEADWRRALAETARIERLPGETLHAAVRRVEREFLRLKSPAL